MSRGIVITEFALIAVAIYFVMSSFVANGTVVGFCSSSSFSGDEGFGWYVFDGFIRIVREVNDGSFVCRWFLWKYLFDQRGSSGGVRVSLLGLFKNDRGW